MAKKAPGAELAQSEPKPSKQDLDYQTEGHLRTLGEAADIMSDPEKMARVHKLAGRKHKALKGMLQMSKSPKIKTMDDLKKKAYSKDNEPDGNDDMEM